MMLGTFWNRIAWLISLICKLGLVFLMYLIGLNIYHRYFTPSYAENLGRAEHLIDRCARSSQMDGMRKPSSNFPWYETVTPSEAFDSGRSHVFPATCSIEELIGQKPPKVVVRTFKGLPGIYNVVTRNPDELFVLGGTRSSDDCTVEKEAKNQCSLGPYVAKMNAHTFQLIWRTPLHNTKNAQEWDYPGAIGVHANGKVFVVAGYQAYRLDPDSGVVEKQIELPVALDHAKGDTTYNGFTLLANGDLIAKSLTRKKGSHQDSIQALLMDLDIAEPSNLVILNPDLQILSTTKFTQPVLGRITNGIYHRQEYIYASGAKDLMRLKVQDSELVFDTHWGPVPYVFGQEKPATAPAMFGEFVVAQSNFQYAKDPLVITAVSQKDPNQVFRLQPFANERGILGSMQWSLPSVDIDNQRIYTVDVLKGSLAAIDFDASRGLQIAWRHDQTALSFSALVGHATKREIVLESGIFGSLQKVFLIWRDAKSGEPKLQSPLLNQGIGLPLTPGFDGVMYYPSHDGSLNELSIQ
jgi:hypothetical protein